MPDPERRRYVVIGGGAVGGALAAQLAVLGRAAGFDLCWSRAATTAGWSGSTVWWCTAPTAPRSSSSRWPQDRRKSTWPWAPPSQGTDALGDLLVADLVAAGLVAWSVPRHHRALGPRTGCTASWTWAPPAKQHAAQQRGQHVNVLTRDVPTSTLTQSTSGAHVLVRVERYDGPLPPVRAYDPPRVAP